MVAADLPQYAIVRRAGARKSRFVINGALHGSRQRRREPVNSVHERNGLHLLCYLE
jgi:hypothetical protein